MAICPTLTPFRLSCRHVVSTKSILARSATDPARERTARTGPPPPDPPQSSKRRSPARSPRTRSSGLLPNCLTHLLGSFSARSPIPRRAIRREWRPRLDCGDRQSESADNRQFGSPGRLPADWRSARRPRLAGPAIPPAKRGPSESAALSPSLAESGHAGLSRVPKP